jgi:preprotein translocase subunit SecA
MFMKLMSKVVGTKNERELKRIQPMVVAINELEPAMKSLTDDDLRKKTAVQGAAGPGGDTRRPDH